MPQNKKKNLPAYELAVYFDSLAMLLAAGVSANECPDIIAEDTAGTRVSAAAKQAGAIIESGETYVLSEAMEKSGCFPEYATDLTKLGEDAGRLEETAQSLGDYYHEQDTLGQNLRAAITGPLILLLMMSVVLIFLLLFVLPVFQSVFESLGITAQSGMGPAFLTAWISMGVVGLLLVVVVIFFIMYMSPSGRASLAGLMEKLPFTKKIHYDISASRFADGLSMLLASGISPGDAFGRASGLVESETISRQLPAAQKEIDEGADLSETVVKMGILQGSEAKILLSASRAGQTEKAMHKIGKIYADEANDRINAALGALEPALVGVVSVAIGVILLSVMLPLTNIMSSLV